MIKKLAKIVSRKTTGSVAQPPAHVTIGRGVVVTVSPMTIHLNGGTDALPVDNCGAGTLAVTDEVEVLIAPPRLIVLPKRA